MRGEDCNVHCGSSRLPAAHHKVPHGWPQCRQPFRPLLPPCCLLLLPWGAAVWWTTLRISMHGLRVLDAIERAGCVSVVMCGGCTGVTYCAAAAYAAILQCSGAGLPLPVAAVGQLGPKCLH